MRTEIDPCCNTQNQQRQYCHKYHRVSRNAFIAVLALYLIKIIWHSFEEQNLVCLILNSYHISEAGTCRITLPTSLGCVEPVQDVREPCRCLLRGHVGKVGAPGVCWQSGRPRLHGTAWRLSATPPDIGGDECNADISRGDADDLGKSSLVRECTGRCADASDLRQVQYGRWQGAE
jgi:hypothetical protein